jgi:hypothetical protein
MKDSPWYDEADVVMALAFRKVLRDNIERLDYEEEVSLRDMVERRLGSYDIPLELYELASDEDFLAAVDARHRKEV